ncbi:MAG: hypothetical protein KGI50_01225 [Patescibacteria group bacterium]|nr:hypothetical protein [Patescibacteria group bacterium]
MGFYAVEDRYRQLILRNPDGLEAKVFRIFNVQPRLVGPGLFCLRPVDLKNTDDWEMFMRSARGDFAHLRETFTIQDRVRAEEIFEEATQLLRS